jgi:phage gpG-like protein
MFTIKLERNTVGEDLLRLVDRISNPGNAQKRSVADAIRRGFQDNFTTQGAAAGTPWRALAPSTVLQRRRLGYAGSNPILVRGGGYRSSWVSDGSDHYSSVRQQGGYTIFEEGSESPLARFHERGGARLPARPVSMLGDGSEVRIVDTIELMIGQLEREVLGR